VSNDSRRQAVLEPFGETGSAIRPSDGPFPLVPAPPSSRSIVISVLSAVVALVYVCSPIDLVPEALVPFVGFVDDVLVFVGAMALARAMLVTALSERARYRKALREYEETEHLYGKWSP
jgi:hypothetical protein